MARPRFGGAVQQAGCDTPRKISKFREENFAIPITDKVMPVWLPHLVIFSVVWKGEDPRDIQQVAQENGPLTLVLDALGRLVAEITAEFPREP